MWIHQFTVEGAGEFPLDMLRYDCCFPATGDDAAKMSSEVRERREITLIRYNQYASWSPTVGRWNSFLWRCDPTTDSRKS